MQNQPESVRMLPKRGGFFCCPTCDKIPATRLIKADRETVAAHLRLYCPKCRREFVVDIIRGQALECASPDGSK